MRNMRSGVVVFGSSKRIPADLVILMLQLFLPALP
jgi:hypothetical protein